jgi:hypothetical protein
MCVSIRSWTSSEPVIGRRPTLERMLRGAPGTLRRRLSGLPGGTIQSGHLAYTSFGRGEGDRLRAMSESLFRHEPDCHLLAVDDVSGERLRDLERNPRVDIVGRWRPRGYPTGLLRLLLESFALAVERYDFDVLLKIDTDALCLRAGVFAEARAHFRNDPGAGIAGSHLPDTKAEREDHRFAWLVPIMEQEGRADRTFGRAWEAALANGYSPGEHVQGGVYVIARPALEALHEARLLHWRPRLEAVLYDDVVLSMFVRAVGFRPVSLEPTILSAPNSLPVPLAELRELRPAVVHTVKRGLEGETEDDLRRALDPTQPRPS